MITGKEEKRTNLNKKIIYTIIILVYLCLFSLVVVKYIDENRYWDIEYTNRNIAVEKGQLITIDAIIKNKMYYEMSSKENYFLSYHILTENNEVLIYDNPRTELEAIAPGHERNIQMQLRAPDQVGKYIIEIDIVKEGEYWLKDRGEKTFLINLTVY